MRKIIGYTPGVFDVFHVGHLSVIKKSKKLCDHLIVAVCSDELTCLTKSTPLIKELDRLNIISSLKFVDEAFIYTNLIHIDYLRKYKVNVFSPGEEFGTLEEHKITLDYCYKNNIQVKFQPRLKGISSSEIKRKISNKQ